MEKYLISLRGCHDTTYMLMDLEQEEVKTLEKVEKLSIQTSSYGCMPTLYIDKFNKEEHDYELREIEYQKQKKIDRQEAERIEQEQQELKKKYNNFKF